MNRDLAQTPGGIGFAAGMESLSEQLEPAAAREISAPRPQSRQVGENRQMTLSEVCDLMSQLIDRELEALAMAGAEAFAAQDMSRVEKTMRRTSKVKALRQQMQTVLSDWKAALTED